MITNHTKLDSQESNQSKETDPPTTEKCWTWKRNPQSSYGSEMQRHTPAGQLYGSEEGEMRVAETRRQAGETHSGMHVVKERVNESKGTHWKSHKSKQRQKNRKK